MKRFFKTSILICGVFVILLGCGSKKEEDNTLHITSVIDMTADKAQESLSNAGFLKITLSADESSGSSMVLSPSNWTVVAQDPQADTEISPDTEIKLYCKKASELEAEKITSEKTKLEAIIKKTLPEATTLLQELGYTATYRNANTGIDCTAELSTGPTEELASWIVTDINITDINNKTVQLSVNTSENIAANEAAAAITATLEAKLGAGQAWQAADDYGKSLYPYGFKLHYLMEQLAQEAQDENTWFLKAECDVTNEYGAEAKMTCEAYVTGTNDAPVVSNFTIY